MIARLAVVGDIVVRCAVLVVTWLLASEFWESANESFAPGESGDRLTVEFLIPPLVLYAAWNVWMIVSSMRRWRAGREGEVGFLANLGVLSLARLLWIAPLADDMWWHARHRLMPLVVASVLVTVLAFGGAIRQNLTSARLEKPA